MTSRDLAGCPLVAALAEAHRAIRKHVTRTERIAFSPTNPPRRRGLPQAIQRKDANRLDFIPPRADRKTASSIECFQVHVIKVEGIHGRLHVSRGTCRVRVFQNESPSKREEGAGNAGREPHPQPRVQNERAHEHSHHRFSRSVRHSPRNGFTVSFALSPVTWLFCHRHRRDAKHRRQLDTCLGVSGPHDFAVRFDVARLATPSRPSHPTPNTRDDREAPLFSGAGRASL